ncbi:MAG: tetratricopeptide repeat protein [Bacteroidales bacterium]|nr:tetratricopeptide repeat protein [Bacteroidales bacterium]
MHDFDEEENEAQELVDRFKTMQRDGISVFFDSEELEIIIDELMQNMDVQTATEAIDYAIKLYPTDSYFRILKVKKLIVEMRFDEAEKELSYVESEFPPTSESYVQRVMLARVLEKPIDAIGLLNRALDIDPEALDAHFMMAFEYLKLKNVPQAIIYATHALREDPFYDEQLFTFSFLLEENKQYEDGILFYSRLTEEFPMYQGCWFGLGLAYSWNKEYDKAIDAYQFVLSIDENTPTAYYNIANCYFENKQFEQALENYKKAYELDPEDYTSLTCIGDCLAIQDKDEEAKDYYHKALSLNPNYGDAILSVANILKNQGNIGEARAFIEKAVSLNPQSIELLLTALSYYDTDEQVDKLNEFFSTTLGQIENKTDFYYYFTTYCCQNELLSIGCAVLEQHKDDPEITDVIGYYLAALYLLRHNVKTACEYLSNALLINYEGHKDFLQIDPIFETFPEVLELIELYKP